MRPLSGAMGALVLEGLFSRLSFGLISFALPLYARHLGFTMSEIGMLVALNTAVSLALKPMMGSLADRVGCKRVLIAGIGLRSVVSGLLALVSMPWHLFAIRAVHGLSMSLRDPSINALIAEEGGEKRAASAFAWYQTAKTIAGQLSKSFAGILLALTGANFAFVFSVAFGLSVLPALVVALFVKGDRWRRAESEADAVTAETGGAGQASRTESGSAFIRPAARDEDLAFHAATAAGTSPGRPSVVPFMGLGFLIRATADMLDGLLPIIAIEYAGLTAAQTGIVYAVACVVLIVSSPLFGWLADHGSGNLVLTVRGAANALSSAVYLVAPGFLGILTAKTLDDLGKAAYRPAWGSLMARVSSFDRRTRARTIGVLTVGEDLGSILAPVLAGFLWSTFGIAAVMGTRIALAILTEVYAVAVAHSRATAGAHARVARRRSRAGSGTIEEHLNKSGI
jgi:MFS family permease